MPNEEADFPKREKNAAKSCCLAALIVGLGFFLLVFAAIAAIIVVDTVNLRGEKMPPVETGGTLQSRWPVHLV